MKRYDYICESVAVVGTAIQTQQVFQIISLILTCLATIISILYSLYCWKKKSLQDGKIDGEDIKELKKLLEEKKQEIEKLKNNKQSGDN